MSGKRSQADLQRQLDQLEAENQSLRLRLEEAEQTLEAIREGAVDALVIDTPEGQRIFSLQSAERPYRALIEQMQEGAVTLVQNGRIHYCNRAFADMLKRPLEAVLGSQLEQHIHRPDRPMVQSMLLDCQSGSAHGEASLIADDGSLVPVYLGLTLVLEGGEGSICMVVTDLSERKRAEAVIAGEQFMRRLIDNAPIGIAVVGRNLRYILANAAYRDIASGAAVVGRSISEVFPPALAGTVESAVQQVIQSDQHVEFRDYEAPVRGRSWWNVDEIPLHDAAGEVEAVLILTQDVTEQKQAQDALRQSNEQLAAANEELAVANEELRTSQEELSEQNRALTEARSDAEVQRQRYEGLFQGAPDGYVVTDRNGSIVEANAAAMAMLGLRSEQTSAVPLAAFVKPEQQTTFLNAATELRRSGHLEPLVVRIGPLRGKRLWAELSASVELAPDGKATPRLRWLIRDVSRRQEAEEALRESHARLKKMLDVEAVGVMFWDLTTGCLVDANDTFLKMMGYSRSDVEAGNLTWQKFTPPEYHEISRAEVTKFMVTGHVGPYEKEYFRKDGTRQWFLFAGSSLGNNQCVEFCVDISERKKAEEELTAARLSAEQAKADAEHASKAKDRFLAVLSHELRTPLTPVVAAVSMLQNDRSFDADTRENLEMIRRNVELEARLIDDLLDVTRIEKGKIELDKQPTDLCSIIRRAIEVCMPDIEARQLEFGVDFGPGTPYIVEADAARLQQIFWNLLKNAIKFTPVGGCVGIRCRQDADNRVIAEVSDSGEGIEPALLPRLFNAFEQGGRQMTRQFGGLGLGLTIGKAMADLHGGTLSAHSAGKGKGATFTLRLPLLPKEAAAAVTPAAALTAPADSVRPLRILLVEDHGDTAKIMRRLLSDQGHEVLAAADVATALKLMTERPFDLMLSDLGLPDGSGLDLMRSIRAKGISVRAIALSGYGQEQDAQQSLEAGFVEHLVKPVSLPKLDEAIAKAMGLGTRVAQEAKNA